MIDCGRILGKQPFLVVGYHPRLFLEEFGKILKTGSEIQACDFMVCSLSCKLYAASV